MFQLKLSNVFLETRIFATISIGWLFNNKWFQVDPLESISESKWISPEYNLYLFFLFRYKHKS